MSQSKILKVYKSYDNQNKVIPEIRLKGHWLQKIGFTEGCEITVDVQKEEIVIKRKIVS